MPNAYTADYWIERFNLQKHPFMNGYFHESFRDPMTVTHPMVREERSASSLIYYLHLPDGRLNSRTVFYQQKSTVTTHFYTGEPVTIYKVHPNKAKEEIVLGITGGIWHVSIEPGIWFTRILDMPKSKSMKNFSLVGVSLSPGFDTEDLITKSYGEIMQ